ncbi:MAG TPA: helix-turn-helix domain-containing protein [Nocardioides sp.]|nr:helix-turn-helix domain-containing protein [Nocardioides sp.]
MPRINAATVAEHVAQQEAAVIDAARRLFGARGVAQVSLGDIAEEVGLGRTSLYRYFPTKAHIFQRWFDTVMDPLLEATEAAVTRPGGAGERLDRWLQVQLDFLLDPEHTALATASLQADELPDDVREHFGARHRELYATLVPVLSTATDDEALIRARVQLIAGLVGSAADLVRAGADRATVTAELCRSARATAGLPARRVRARPPASRARASGQPNG